MTEKTDTRTEGLALEFPLPEGERYEAVIPDTLDLAERAELALNGLGGTIHPEIHYEPYAYIFYAHKTPVMRHDGCALTCAPKYAESFPLLRIMCGSDLYAEREVGLMRELAFAISSEDGLYYHLYRNRPWHTSYHEDYYGGPSTEDYANAAANGRMLRAMIAWRERDGNRIWDDRIRAMVAGLAKIAVDKGEYAYYPNDGVGEACSYPRRTGWKKTDEPARDDEGGEGTITAYHGHQIYGLAQWYAVSGDEAALELARKLATFCMKSCFWGAVYDPLRVAGEELAHINAHTHGRLLVLRGLLEYARVSNDFRVMEFVRSGYEFARTLGIARIGWLSLVTSHAVTESCVQADLIALGVRLSDLGLGDYWDDVDAVVRNAFIEQQVARADLLEKVAAASLTRFEEVTDKRYMHPNQVCREKVIERTLGTFFSWPGVTSVERPWVLLCCTGNGTQGLYYAWEGALRYEGGTALVNLLLNRASPWADVDSYLPYEGKVVVKSKSAKRIGLRIPAWVDRNRVTGAVNNTPAQGDWVGNRLFFDVRDKDEVTLQFPVPATTARYTVMSKVWKLEATYTCTFRGSTLVDISPRDKAATSYPLYVRDHMRQDKAPMRRVTRFATSKIMRDW